MTLKAIRQATSLLELANASKRAARTIKSEMNEQSKSAALFLAQKLIYETPVDTSLAITNWQVEIGKKTDTILRPHIVGTEGSTYDESTSIAIMQAYGDIQRKKYGDVVHVFNNAKHIEELNEGKSGQAAAGFVDAIVKETEKHVNEKLKRFVNGD